MPLGIVTSQAEMDLIKEIWPDPEKGMPFVSSGIVHFAPDSSRRIVDEIQRHEGADDAAATRLVNRIVDIAGKSFFAGDQNPVDPEPETPHIDEEDSADGEGFYLNDADDEIE